MYCIALVLSPAFRASKANVLSCAIASSSELLDVGTGARAKQSSDLTK